MTQLLIANAFAQFVVSSLVGFAMLLPRQPWFRAKWPIRQRDLLSAHLDWIMLGLVQVAAGVAMTLFAVPHQGVVTGLLVFGGWVNAAPYLLRGVGIDAFVVAGSPMQRLSALLSGTSSAALLVAFVMIASASWSVVLS